MKSFIEINNLTSNDELKFFTMFYKINLYCISFDLMFFYSNSRSVFFAFFVIKIKSARLSETKKNFYKEIC